MYSGLDFSGLPVVFAFAALGFLASCGGLIWLAYLAFTHIKIV